MLNNSVLMEYASMHVFSYSLLFIHLFIHCYINKTNKTETETECLHTYIAYAGCKIYLLLYKFYQCCIITNHSHDIKKKE